jgi:hypothetical protein
VIFTIAYRFKRLVRPCCSHSANFSTYQVKVGIRLCKTMSIFCQLKKELVEKEDRPNCVCDAATRYCRCTIIPYCDKVAIEFLVNKICQFLHVPTSTRWIAPQQKYAGVSFYRTLVLNFFQDKILPGVFLLRCKLSQLSRGQLGGFVIFLVSNLILWNAYNKNVFSH